MGMEASTRDDGLESRGGQTFYLKNEDADLYIEPDRR